jgi:hypothetical protein
MKERTCRISIVSDCSVRSVRAEGTLGYAGRGTGG